MKALGNLNIVIALTRSRLPRELGLEVNRAGQTAIDIATKKGHQIIAVYLRLHAFRFMKMQIELSQPPRVATNIIESLFLESLRGNAESVYTIVSSSDGKRRLISIEFPIDIINQNGYSALLFAAMV